EPPQRVFPGTALRRFAGLHTRGAAALGGGVRRKPYHDRHRFSVSLDDHARRPRAQHAGVEQRGQACDFGRECGEALADPELERVADSSWRHITVTPFYANIENAADLFAARDAKRATVAR